MSGDASPQQAVYQLLLSCRNVSSQRDESGPIVQSALQSSVQIDDPNGMRQTSMTHVLCSGLGVGLPLIDVRRSRMSGDASPLSGLQGYVALANISVTDASVHRSQSRSLATGRVIHRRSLQRTHLQPGREELRLCLDTTRSRTDMRPAFAGGLTPLLHALAGPVILSGSLRCRMSGGCNLCRPSKASLPV